MVFDSDVSAYRVPTCSTCGAWDAHQACVIQHAITTHRDCVTDIVLRVVRVDSTEANFCLKHFDFAPDPSKR